MSVTVRTSQGPVTSCSLATLCTMFSRALSVAHFEHRNLDDDVTVRAVSRGSDGRKVVRLNVITCSQSAAVRE